MQGNNKIRKISFGQVSTVAGTGAPGSNDGFTALATFRGPRAIAFDATGATLYIADTGSNKIRFITILTGQLSSARRC